MVRETYQALSRSHFREERAKTISKLRELGKVLLGPLAGRLGGKRLLIVASGVLQSIPFTVLPDPDASAARSGHWPPWPQLLLERHEVVYEPSATVLAEIRRARQEREPARRLMAVLADGVFSRRDKRLRGFAFHGPESVFDRLPRLKATREEAEAITADLPASEVTKLLEFDARKDAVLAGALENHRVIHVAMHTFYPTQVPDTAAIILSRFDRRGREIGSLLRAQDVAGLDLRSDLVVLSSCSSAMGQTVPGEGMIGLPRAFMAAGSSSVMMSLWDVGDKVTAELMKGFYRHLRTGNLSPSGALRQAQLEMLRDRRRSSPWYWAGFITQGEWKVRPFSLNKNPAAVSPKNGSPRRPATMRKPLQPVPLR